MRIAFRTDVSVQIGTGHFQRCLTLANALFKPGIEIRFCCRHLPPQLQTKLQQRGYQVRIIDAPSEASTEQGPPHAEWLGTSQLADATSCKEALSDGEWDLLVVDHYALDERWEREMRSCVKKIFVIDDLADRVHDCDWLLDQTIISTGKSRYNKLTPPGARVLEGAEYALLQPAYAKLHSRIPPRSGPIKRILVSFGGVDEKDVTGRVVAAFLGLGYSKVTLDVVVGGQYQHLEDLRKIATGYSNVVIHRDLPTLAGLIAKADLAVGAAGTSSWERLCLGLPTVVLTLAENQRYIAESLQKMGVITWLGDESKITEADLAGSLALMLERGSDSCCSELCLTVVDGQGCERVCRELMADTWLLPTRFACPADERFLNKWCDENPVLEEGPNGESSFVKFFREKLRDIDNVCCYVSETPGGLPGVLVCFEKDGESWTCRWMTDPAIPHKDDIVRRAIAAAWCILRSEVDGLLTFNRVSPAIGADLARKPNERFDVAFCSDAGSWISGAVSNMVVDWVIDGHRVSWVHDASLLKAGDVCYYLSYGRIVDGTVLSKYNHNLVVHASDLPRGKGWSPLTWQILEGKNSIPVTLFEAAEAVDSGVIYRQVVMECSGDELIDELRVRLSRVSEDLCRWFLDGYPDSAASGRPQVGDSTFYPRRRAKDSRLDPERSLQDQFNLLRTVDPVAYPAWFERNGSRYNIKIEKVKNI